jgi:hypothetical protein
MYIHPFLKNNLDFMHPQLFFMSHVGQIAPYNLQCRPFSQMNTHPRTFHKVVSNCLNAGKQLQCEQHTAPHHRNGDLAACAGSGLIPAEADNVERSAT